MQNCKIARVNKKGFTLAEVLITLALIGVVAAMAIPILLTNTNKSEYVVALKKAYSTFSQALILYKADNGDISSIFTAGGDAGGLNQLAPYLNIFKNCGSTMGCWYNTEQKSLGGKIFAYYTDGAYNNQFGKAILADGSMILLDGFDGGISHKGDGPLYRTYGIMHIDINGSKGPNRRGRDVFLFYITETGLYPYGTYNDGKSCVATSMDYATSEGCSGKVLQENAMNY